MGKHFHLETKSERNTEVNILGLETKSEKNTGGKHFMRVPSLRGIFGTNLFYLGTKSEMPERNLWLNFFFVGDQV